MLFKTKLEIDSSIGLLSTAINEVISDVRFLFERSVDMRRNSAAALVLKSLGDKDAHDAIRFAVESTVRLTMEDRQRKLQGSA